MYLAATFSRQATLVTASRDGVKRSKHLVVRREHAHVERHGAHDGGPRAAEQANRALLLDDAHLHTARLPLVLRAQADIRGDGMQTAHSLQSGSATSTGRLCAGPGIHMAAQCNRASTNMGCAHGNHMMCLLVSNALKLSRYGLGPRQGIANALVVTTRCRWQRVVCLHADQRQVRRRANQCAQAARRQPRRRLLPQRQRLRAHIKGKQGLILKNPYEITSAPRPPAVSPAAAFCQSGSSCARKHEGQEPIAGFGNTLRTVQGKILWRTAASNLLSLVHRACLKLGSKRAEA